jgi:hypothetical protein
MTMPARDALHWQIILKDSLAPGGIMGAFLDGFERSQRGMGLPDGAPAEIDAVPNPVGMFAPSVPYDESGDALRRYFARGIDLSLPFYVDPKMNILITAAAESLPSDTTVQMHDLPNSHGFMVIPQGVAEIDLRGQLMVHNAIAWFQRAGGVDIWLMSNKYDPKDMVNERQRRMFGEEGYAQMPELMPASYMRVEFGQRVPWSMGSTKTLPPEIVETMQVLRQPDGSGYGYAWGEGYDMNEWLAESMEMRPSGPMLWLYATWRLMQQTITDVRTEGVDRGLRRAAEKRKMKTQQVTVIHLRKRKAAVVDGEEQHIEWSHSWLVRGHWRQQWYGPKNGDENERFQVPIWIHPHLKGPEDAPLLVRDHIYSLDR